MNRIRQLRRQKNMTQQDVGQALGVGNTAVSMYASCLDALPTICLA